MGALPSRESNEDPSSVFFANCGLHIVFHIPMTDHYFPSSNSLAFRQLFHARNSQSALYCFDMKDMSPVMPVNVAEAFREAQQEDWGAELNEADPSLHYCDDEIREEIRKCVGNLGSTRGAAGAGAALGCSPRVGRHARPSIEDREELYRVLVTEPMEGTLVDTDSEMCALLEQEQRWRAALPHLCEGQQQQGRSRNKRSSVSSGHGDAEAAATGSLSVDKSAVFSESPLPPPPAKFLYPLPQAIALRMTTEEEEEMRSEYCRKHHIPYIAPAFHDVRPTGVGAAPRAPLPVVERRHYHFEDDPRYRDGRVHLIEEHGVLYHFAYLVKGSCRAAVSSHGSRKAEATASVAPSTVVSDSTTRISKTPIVRGRCLHDVVYCEKPPASSSASADGEPEAPPPVRYSWCARCGERVTQRMDHTQLRRLMSTRAHRRAALEQHADNDVESPQEQDDVDEVVSNTEHVDEDGDKEFIINIAPVRVVGLDGLIPSRSRGTQWLRGYEQNEAAEDAYIEELERKPPVMRVCRFIEGSVGDKIVNRAALVTLLSYRPMCRQAGLRDVLTRPIWSTCVLSNIPYLQMVRETSFRAKAAVAEVDGNDQLLRNWLDVVDRENNFYNFINANLYMARIFTPPECPGRQREQTDDVANTGTAVSQRMTTGECDGGQGDGVRTGRTDSSPAKSPLQLKKVVYTASSGSGSHAKSRSASSARSPSRCGTVPTVSAAADSSPLAPSTAAPPSSDGGAPAAVAARESADTAGLTTDAAAQGVRAQGKGTRGDSKVTEGDGAELRSHYLTRDQEDDDEDEEGGEPGARESDTTVKAAARCEKSKKKLHRTSLKLLSAFRSASPSSSALSVAQHASDSAAAPPSPHTETTEGERGSDWDSSVTASVMGGLSAVIDTRCEGLQHRSAGNEKSGDTSVENPATIAPAASRTLPSAATGQGTGGKGEPKAPPVNVFEDDDDPVLRLEGKGRRCSGTAVTGTAAAGRSSRKDSTADAAETQARCAEQQQKCQQQFQRPEVPPRPNFQRFSSRLESHAPLLFYTPFGHDDSADEVAKRTVTQLAAAVVAGVVADNNHVGSRDEDGVSHMVATSADAAAATTVRPSCIQCDILRADERWQAEAEVMRRRSHTVYECGMLATTRGRCFLFLLREDYVRALLYYCSAAAAPIFIGAYIEPVDTTSVSYGGAVRLRLPSTVDIPLDGDDEDDGSRTAPVCNHDGQRVVIEQVEGMEVMADYFKSKGLITCFSVSDVDKAAPGPSAAHRLRKMDLSPASSSSSSAHHFSDNGGLAGEARLLAARQARELAQYSYVFTYAADEFCDGDLVVFNFDERRWEHYEQVQLRRQVAAEASAAPAETAEAATTGDAAAAAGNSLSRANSVVDPSMSTRLLCVGLDELLLNWTKLIVDNRFYEDRTDLGWLSLPDGSPIQLGGRYFLWSFRHNHQRYFYGVIPKFAKGRLRRQKLIERCRNKKKGAEAPRQQAQPLAETSTVSSTGARRSSKLSEASSAPSAAVLVTGAAADPSSPVCLVSESTWRKSGTRKAQSEELPRWRGNGTGTGSLHADPALEGPASSSSPHARFAISPPARTSTTPKQSLPQECQPPSATARAASVATASGSRQPSPAQQRQHFSSHHLRPQQPVATGSAPMPQWAYTSVSVSHFGAAPATARRQAQQGSLESSLDSVEGFSCAPACKNVARPPLCSSTIATEWLAAAAATTTKAAHRVPFPKPSPQQSGSSSGPTTFSPTQKIILGAEASYYYQYGGNTCIQDGKRYENEYYPPLPISTPFHPVTTDTKLVPLPHPQTERGGIPAIFRFWGPVGLPAPRIPVAALFPSNAGGAAVTVTASPTARDYVGDGGSAGISESRPPHYSTCASFLAGPPAAPATVPASTAAAVGASASNLTVRVRRRTGGGNTALTAAIDVGSGDAAAPLQPPSPVASLTTLTATALGMGFSTPYTHSPVASSYTPVTSWFAATAPVLLLVDDGGQRRLSPTSMLPTNLINEGSKTKGESVLRVDEDKYMQREAFRWNPYASTKWVQNSGSTDGGASVVDGGDLMESGCRSR
ncbi:hypothetical protein GH5_07566 [Leishmania sp. Ghana 2012 LV757]|uniref:hypothetical protein n=1 Tax=Leishmania sp. Ghana 2012 LV757 TaxID=2803181 RepID=UPI001B5F11DF|nr:hypothetical protein GH5_07566 [Leishmania sp. Ghana 2012 LV757]